MIARPAFLDEQARIQSLCSELGIPANSQFVVVVIKQPVERLVTIFPWYTHEIETDGEKQLQALFVIHPVITSRLGDSMAIGLKCLESAARDSGAQTLKTRFSLLSDSAPFQLLCDLHFRVRQTDRYFQMPGDLAKKRASRVYQRVFHKIPPDWQVCSIRGQSRDAIYSIVAYHKLMPPEQFAAYWDATNSERFDEALSCVVLDGEHIVAVSLLTRRPDDEVHVHVDAISPEYRKQSGFATIAMRNFYGSACPEGYPRIFTSRADSCSHVEGGNTPIRLGGSEEQERHFLTKSL